MAKTSGEEMRIAKPLDWGKVVLGEAVRRSRFSGSYLSLKDGIHVGKMPHAGMRQFRGEISRVDDVAFLRG